MSETDVTDLVLGLIFWPGLILGTHYFYVRKRCHPDWVPWKATAHFLWGLAWPFLLALAVGVTLVFALGGSPQSDTASTLSRVLAPLIVFGAMLPAFGHARRIIQNPPR